MSQSVAPQTYLVQAGRDSARFAGMVNTPIFRGSTILSSTLAQWESRKTPENPMASYGRFGSPTTQALEKAVAGLEGGFRSWVFPSGLSACTHSILALVEHGDHVLMSDSVYGPTRQFALRVLRRMGVNVTFFDPESEVDISSRMTSRTRVVYLESPGSATFEVQDVSAIARQAHAAGAFVVMDNTWATPLYFKPFEHGVDISVQAATKYIVGHSDALLGVATANQRAWPWLEKGAHDFGQTAGPDDIFLALRGLRSLSVRLPQHWASGLELAGALQAHPMVKRVLHPALPGNPGHALWKRDFLGASGLFAMVIQPIGRESLHAFFERLELFGIGLSWGGYESLALPMDPPARSVKPWVDEGVLIRIHAGLECPEDLVRDMLQALDYVYKN